MSLEITIHCQRFTLLPERAIIWQNTNTLILTDIHLGKSGHFRKSGIAAPQYINETNLVKMDHLIESYAPHRVLILGDLFHSDANREWLRFEEWRISHRNVEFILITGNHDTLHHSFYQSAYIRVYAEFEEQGFHFIHHVKGQAVNENRFTFSGHIHPGILLRGKGRQSLRLPCFYQSSSGMIVPAFGKFTGMHILKAADAEQIYPIADQTVFQLQTI